MSLSTHVLDAGAGRPAPDLPVRLERREDDGVWTELAQGRTDGDGRLKDFPAIQRGTFRLVFDTAEVSTFYPEVTVAFTISDPEQHYHVPLLLSPFAYSTYRGS